MINYGNYGYHAYDDISATEAPVGNAGDTREQVFADRHDGNVENGWYLRSDGYMTSECSYQRVTAMKVSRALNIGGRLVFVKFMGGEEVDNRVYIPHSGTCKVVGSSTSNLVYPDYMTKWYELSCGHSVTLKGDIPPSCCPVCERLVTR